MTHVIKYHDEFGDWFWMRPGRWSDDYADAHHFTRKTEARDEADAAELRLDKRDGYHRKARCKIVDIRLEPEPCERCGLRYDHRLPLRSMIVSNLRIPVVRSTKQSCFIGVSEMAKKGELKKGDVVVFNKRKDAARFLVDDVVGFDLYIQEINDNGETYSAIQRSDVSLAIKVG